MLIHILYIYIYMFENMCVYKCVIKKRLMQVHGFTHENSMVDLSHQFFVCLPGRVCYPLVI